MDINICENADKVLGQFLQNTEVETSHNRMISQQIKCGYGLQGVCCKLCSNGPCRLSRARTRGVCGADADTIVARNFLRQVAAGSGCYIHVVENTAKRLKEIAQNKGEIKGVEALHSLCDELSINGVDDYEKALNLANAIISDLRLPYEEQMVLTEKIGYTKRIELWKKLGIMPRGAKDEVFDAIVKTSTNLSSNVDDMLTHSLRLGISTGIYGLILTNLLNDIINGEAEISFKPVGMRVIDEDYVNIMITGHQQSMYTNTIEVLKSEDVQNLAKTMGAKGIRLVGCTCVGQDLQLRHNQCENVFCGHAGNNYTSEAVLLTGCVDLVVSDFNCTIPGIEEICKKMGIPQICVDDVAMKNDAILLPYSYEEKDNITTKIISTSLVSYANRKKKFNRVNVMKHHGNDTSIVGVTEKTLKEFLGGSFKPIIDAIAEGKIKGIAAVVGCSNLRAKGHDVFTVDLVRELIKKDILVVSAGCTCGGLANCGLMSPEAIELCGTGLAEVCKKLGVPPVLNFGPCLAIGRIELVTSEIAKVLGVDLNELPVVVSAPQWLEEQALADGAFALTLGFPLHLGLPPFVTGSEKVVDILTNKMKEITGGHLFIDTEVDSTCATIVDIINEKRRGLGLNAY